MLRSCETEQTVKPTEIFSGTPESELPETVEERIEEIISDIFIETPDPESGAAPLEENDTENTFSGQLIPNNEIPQVSDPEFYKKFSEKPPRLKREEEVFLFQLLDKKKNAERQLKEDDGTLTNTEKQELTHVVQEGVEATEYLVNANQGLVKSIAQRYSKKCGALEYDDLVQAGNIGLLNAIDRFDWTKGHKLSTNATRYITWSILQEIQENGRQIRVSHRSPTIMKQIRYESDTFIQENKRNPTLEELSEITHIELSKLKQILIDSQKPVSLDAPAYENEAEDGPEVHDLIASPQPTQIEQIFQKELIELLQSLLNKLPPEERKVLVLRYGLNDREEYTYKKIAQKLNRTDDQIELIAKRAGKNLRNLPGARQLINDL